MAAGDISKREIMCLRRVGSAAMSQQPVGESQAEVLASVGSETSTTHLLDGASVGAKLGHTPSHGHSLVPSHIPTKQIFQSVPSDCPLNVTLWGSAG